VTDGSLAGRDGIVDAAGLPGFGGMDEDSEEGAGQGADGVGAFGVPLDSEDEVIGRVELNSFDDTVGGGDSSDAEVVACVMDGLMVAGVHIRLHRLGIVLSQASLETWGTHCRAK
jgi:hypothetical protein